MKAIELQEAVQLKNKIINTQSKRIKLLEEKFSSLRQKYFQLKYQEDKINFHLSELSSKEGNFNI